MKKTKFYLGAIAVMLASAMASCSADDPIEGNGNDGQEIIDNGEAVYMTVNVQLPVAGSNGRSTTENPDDDYSTSSNGTEVGKDRENTVSNMLIVLARKSDNGFITFGEVNSASNIALSTNKTSLRATSKFSKTAIASYYSNPAFSQEINLFVICNYTDEIVAKFKEGVAPLSNAWLNEVCEVVESSKSTSKNTTIWAENNFLMTNAVIAAKMLPATIKDWDAYTSERTPLDLSLNVSTPSGEYLANNGAVRVERAVARFDFRDGHPAADAPANTYHVVATVLGDDPNAQPTNIVDIRLDRMALVNMSNKFYYYRRVTPGGICMPELPFGLSGVTGNYVEDVDFATKRPGFDAFNYPLFNPENNKVDEIAREQWDSYLISDVLENDKDEFGDKRYHIWRYVTENTVNNTSRMTEGLSTGVVFKGKMIPTDAARQSDDEGVKHLADVLDYKAAGLSHNTNADPILYTFGGNLYVTWENVRKAAIKAATTTEGTVITTNAFYTAVFGTATVEKDEDGNIPTSTDTNSPDYKWAQWNKAGKPSDHLLQEFKKAATTNGITLYQSSEDEKDGWGYYCYYFYWNRHNDNGNNGVMGDMEFGVVRNNVYKLAVTNINRLGHPRLSDNDPDPENPDNPDESGDVYISLSVEVMPWTVRENNIEF